MRKTEYLYNGQGDSITRTEKYFYSGSALLYTQNSAGALCTENILDLNGSIIASKRFDDDDDPNTPYELEDQHFFYHYDVRGSVMNIVRPNGTLIEGYAYDEFGNKTQTEYDSAGNEITDPNDEIFENEVTFTSSITDTSTGLQYMNARYYEPTTGRFISQDTYSGNAYDPWTQHLYSYCGNNPTNFIDPTGHKAMSATALFAQARKYEDKYQLWRGMADRAKASMNKLGEESAYYSSFKKRFNSYSKKSKDYYFRYKDTLRTAIAMREEENRSSSSGSSSSGGSGGRSASTGDPLHIQTASKNISPSATYPIFWDTTVTVSQTANLTSVTGDPDSGTYTYTYARTSNGNTSTGSGTRLGTNSFEAGTVLGDTFSTELAMKGHFGDTTLTNKIVFDGWNIQLSNSATTLFGSGISNTTNVTINTNVRDAAITVTAVAGVAVACVVGAPAVVGAIATGGSGIIDGLSNIFRSPILQS